MCAIKPSIHQSIWSIWVVEPLLNIQPLKRLGPGEIRLVGAGAWPSRSLLSWRCWGFWNRRWRSYRLLWIYIVINRTRTNCVNSDLYSYTWLWIYDSYVSWETLINMIPICSNVTRVCGNEMTVVHGLKPTKTTVRATLSKWSMILSHSSGYRSN